MNKNSKLILVYVSAVEKLHFFLRFKSVSEFSGYDFKVLTHSASIKVCYPKAKLIKYTKKAPVSQSVLSLIKDSLEWKASAELDECRVEGGWQSCYDIVEEYHGQYEKVFCFLWNGSTLMEALIGEISKQLEIECRYFEIGNFPGKIFVDPLGVNCKASISNVEYLRKYYFNEDGRRHRLAWLEAYRKNASVTHRVRQASNITKINGWFVVDWIWSFINKPAVRLGSISSKVKAKLKNRIPMPVSAKRYGGGFIFYPCQVSSDSQLLLNSNHNNIDALKLLASKTSEQDDVAVVVKLHPAEPDFNEIEKIVRFCEANGFIISDRSVPDLIESAVEIVTINSTVGLQGLLFEKPVKILGLALYKDYLLDDLLIYITEYLLDVEYFGVGNIELPVFQKIIERKLMGGLDDLKS